MRTGAHPGDEKRALELPRGAPAEGSPLEGFDADFLLERLRGDLPFEELVRPKG